MLSLRSAPLLLVPPDSLRSRRWPGRESTPPEEGPARPPAAPAACITHTECLPVNKHTQQKTTTNGWCRLRPRVERIEFAHRTCVLHWLVSNLFQLPGLRSIFCRHFQSCEDPPTTNDNSARRPASPNTVQLAQLAGIGTQCAQKEILIASKTVLSQDHSPKTAASSKAPYHYRHTTVTILLLAAGCRVAPKTDTYLAAKPCHDATVPSL